MPVKGRIQKKKPTAANKIKKIDKDLLSSQFSQQQNTQSQQYIKTPVRRNIAPNALVGKNQSIFSPDKKENELSDRSDDGSNLEEDDSGKTDEEESDNTESSSETDGNDSDDIMEIGEEEYTKTSLNKLKDYTAPLNTNNWQPLPQQMHHELSNLLHLLIPVTTDNQDEKIAKVLEADIVKPLVKKFSTIRLPPLQRNVRNKLQQLRASGEFNLSYLHQEQMRLSQGYDINSKQLDMLSLQLIKEKDMLETEKKYVAELKGKVKQWQKNKSARIERLKTLLGAEFTEMRHLLDSRASGLDGVDDIDLVLSSDTEPEDYHDTEVNDKTSKKLKTLNKKLIQTNKANKSAAEMQMALEQLLNILKR
ncbi:hypothetical protein CANINC_005013 [Pichia inconspicua]|uniref:Uncharacterized protein n=1 Tax=Pichia inconspicua TaxID=52247 RepID=A0A4T0WUZ3_9ASCO|nr:hypothetical protein CANINC_005013 [[Candida] inconspicua]